MSRYELVIKNESKKKNTANVGGAGGVNAAQGTESTGGGENTDGTQEQDAGKLLKKVFSYQQVKSVASQVIGHEVSMVQLRSGSQHAQQRATFAYSIAQQGIGLAEGIIGGALVGNAPGAIIGAISSLTSTALSWTFKAETMSMQKQLEQSEQNMQAQRATVSGSRYQTILQE